MLIYHFIVFKRQNLHFHLFISASILTDRSHSPKEKLYAILFLMPQSKISTPDIAFFQLVIFLIADFIPRRFTKPHRIHMSSNVSNINSIAYLQTVYFIRFIVRLFPYFGV